MLCGLFYLECSKVSSLVCRCDVFYCTPKQLGTIPQRSTDLLTPVKINTQFSGGISSAIEQRKSEQSNSFMKEKEDQKNPPKTNKNPKPTTNQWLMILWNASEVIYFSYKYKKYNLSFKNKCLGTYTTHFERTIPRDLNSVEWSCNVNGAIESFSDTCSLISHLSQNKYIRL